MPRHVALTPPRAWRRTPRIFLRSIRSSRRSARIGKSESCTNSATSLIRIRITTKVPILRGWVSHGSLSTCPAVSHPTRRSTRRPPSCAISTSAGRHSSSTPPSPAVSRGCTGLRSLIGPRKTSQRGTDRHRDKGDRRPLISPTSATIFRDAGGSPCAMPCLAPAGDQGGPCGPWLCQPRTSGSSSAGGSGSRDSSARVGRLARTIPSVSSASSSSTRGACLSLPRSIPMETSSCSVRCRCTSVRLS